MNTTSTSWCYHCGVAVPPENVHAGKHDCGYLVVKIDVLNGSTDERFTCPDCRGRGTLTGIACPDARIVTITCLTCNGTTTIDAPHALAIQNGQAIRTFRLAHMELRRNFANLMGIAEGQLRDLENGRLP